MAVASPFSLESPERALEELLVPQPPAPVAGALAPSPYNFEFTGEDAIRLTVHNSQSGCRVAVHWRMWNRQRTIQANRHEFTPATDRTPSSVEFSIGEGYLLNMTTFASEGSPRRGQTFARVQVIRGRDAAAVVLGTAIQGYVTGNQDRAWPGSPIEGALDGDGFAREIVGTDPAAGAEVDESVPTGAVWELLTLKYTLVTSAAVATRVPSLAFQSVGGSFFRSELRTTLGASSNLDAFYSQGMTVESASVNGYAIAGLSRGIRLFGGHRISSATTALQAGDNHSAPRYLVREWLEVP